MSYDKAFTTDRQHSATVIAKGVRVEGDFSSQGDVLIEGEVQGRVATTGMLQVGSQAVLKADVSAEKAVIAGSVEGNLTVTSHLDLKSTAKVVGDIACDTISVESGATMNGKIVVGKSSVQSPRSQGRNRAGMVQTDSAEVEQ